MLVDELLQEARRRYPPGTIINQQNAYGGLGNTYKIIDSKAEYSEVAGNLSIGGIGVWHKKWGIWAEVISYPENYSPYKIYELWT